jgi:hypothetical protein
LVIKSFMGLDLDLLCLLLILVQGMSWTKWAACSFDETFFHIYIYYFACDLLEIYKARGEVYTIYLLELLLHAAGRQYSKFVNELATEADAIFNEVCWSYFLFLLFFACVWGWGGGVLSSCSRFMWYACMIKSTRYELYRYNISEKVCPFSEKLLTEH